MIISKRIFSLQIFINVWVIPPFRFFSLFSLYQGHELTDYDIQYIKLKLWTSRIIVYSLVILAELWRHQMTS